MSIERRFSKKANSSPETVLVTNEQFREQQRREFEKARDERLRIAAKIAGELERHYTQGREIGIRDLNDSLERWERASDIYANHPFPNTEGRVTLVSGNEMNYNWLYHAQPELWELLGDFSGPIRHYTNVDANYHGSGLVPEHLIREINKMYDGVAEKVWKYAHSIKDGEEPDESFVEGVRQEIELCLRAFHEAADPYPVAEALLASNHPDLFSKIVEDLLLLGGYGEKGAVEYGTKLFTYFFPKEYGNLLKACLETHKTALDYEEAKRFSAVYYHILEK